MISEEADEAPVAATPRSYENTAVRLGEWWEEAAWTESTGGQRAPASMGARPFGRRQGCSQAFPDQTEVPRRPP